MDEVQNAAHAAWRSYEIFWQKMVDRTPERRYTVCIVRKEGIQMAEQYQNMSDLELVQTYNAVMANAYPGDEAALEGEIERRGLDVDAQYFY